MKKANARAAAAAASMYDSRGELLIQKSGERGARERGDSAWPSSSGSLKITDGGTKLSGNGIF